MPRVSVIIVNYNAGDWLAKSVASVAAQTLSDFECFIIDNGSTDGSIDALPALDNRFEIIKLGENTGFARANNIGAQRARADWIALLNPDAFARPEWLEQLLASANIEDGVTMVGSTQYLALEPDKYDGTGDCYSIYGLAYRSNFGHAASAPPPTGEVFAPCAAAALYHRETFLALGGFDERFFCYHEDVDLALRMRLAGGRCVQNGAAIVDHVSSGISGRASAFAVYHGTRNRIWTFFKSMPGPLLVALLPLFIATNLAMLFWALFRPGRFAPTAKGIWHGVKGLPDIAESRRAVQAARTISSAKLWKGLTKSPIKVIRRGADIRNG